MREQLRRTQERMPDPALSRDRVKERIAFYERDARLLKLPLKGIGLQAIGGKRWWRKPATIAVLAFALGAASTLAAMGVVLGRGAPVEEPLVPAALIAEAPTPPRTIAVRAPAAAVVPDLRPDPTPAGAVTMPAAADAPVALMAAVDVAAPETVVMNPGAAEPVALALAVVETPAPPSATDTAPAAALAPADDTVLARVNRTREIQSLLAALGYVPGRADGDAGPQTLTAAALFATERGLADSNLDAALLAALRAARAGALPVRSSNAGAETVLERVTRVREIQTLLVANGYDLGRPDGDAGPQTLTAAASYAAARGLADANLDAAFLAVMREGAAG